MTIVEHLEGTLGPVCRGWRKKSAPFQVVCFDNQPFIDIKTYTTMGLSNTELEYENGEAIRQELLFMAYRNFDEEYIAFLLTSIGEYIADTGKPLLRGQVLGPSSSVIMGSLLNSIYAAIPVILPETFYVFNGYNSPTTFIWVIPIHEEEANFVRLKGWAKFEDLLQRCNPELWDLQRTSIV